jgi:hypothetical protein
MERNHESRQGSPRTVAPTEEEEESCQGSSVICASSMHIATLRFAPNTEPASVGHW